MFKKYDIFKEVYRKKKSIEISILKVEKAASRVKLTSEKLSS